MGKFRMVRTGAKDGQPQGLPVRGTGKGEEENQGSYKWVVGLKASQANQK